MHTDYEDGVSELFNGKELTPENLFWHAEEVIKGRWPEAEPIIMKDLCCACDYAQYVIKGRWPEAEPAIMTDPTVWSDYCKHFGIA